MNPFSYGSIARGDNFYDRREETTLITNTLAGGNNVVLFAPRRYGKTSLVFRVIDALKEQNIECIYLDLMPIYSVEHLATTYIKKISAIQTSLERFVANVRGALRFLRPTIYFDDNGAPQLSVEFNENKVSADTIADILDLPEIIAEKNGRRVVVVFDEFQEITKFDKLALESLFRSKFQGHQHVNYLFLGSKTHILANMFQTKNRPFYASAKAVQISHLPEADTIAFLQDRFESSNISISAPVCQYIIQIVSDIPYYIQFLAAEIWQYAIGTTNIVTTEIVDLCAQQVVHHKEDYYHELFDRHSTFQKKLLKAIAQSGANIYSADYARRFHFGATSTIQKAADALTEEGLIDKENNTHFVCDPFFRRYLLVD